MKLEAGLETEGSVEAAELGKPKSEVCLGAEAGKSVARFPNGDVLGGGYCPLLTVVGSVEGRRGFAAGKSEDEVGAGTSEGLGPLDAVEGKKGVTVGTKGVDCWALEVRAVAGG